MNYNWDDMECNPDSSSFFNKRHPKHEKLDINNPNNAQYEEGNNKENVRNVLNTNHLSKEDQKIQIENYKVEKIELNEKPAKESEMVQVNAVEVHETENSNNRKNIFQGPIYRTLKKESFKINKNIPSVCKYVQIYEQKKQQQFEKIIAEDRKNRIFHANPAPKYLKTDIKQTEKKDIKVTIPKTPMVLKKSKEFEERRKQIMEQNKTEIPIFTPRDAHVVHEKPFKPDLKVKSVTIVKPFQLKVTSRLEERSVYDNDCKKRIEEQQKQKDELENEEKKRKIREIRKATTFKARPNPFK